MSPIDPEIFDTFDTFNISRVLHFLLTFSRKCRPNRSKTLTFEKKRFWGNVKGVKGVKDFRVYWAE